MNDKIIYVDSNDFEKVVLKSDRPVVVDFYSDECPPCEALAPIYEKMAETYGDNIKFVKIFRQENRELAEQLKVLSSPTVLFFKDGRELGDRLNGFLNKQEVRSAIEEVFGEVLPRAEIKQQKCDVIILGAGPAGLSAAIYAARAKLDTVVLDISVPGGQAASTYHIANYPGTPGVINGMELTGHMLDQALSFGARVENLQEVSEVDLQNDLKTVCTENIHYQARAVIIASGARPRMLLAEGADKYKGRGVHYCATCDGAMYEGREVAVIGGGNSAVEEAVFLTRFASHVTIIHQFDHFQASQTAQEEAFANGKISVIWDSEVRQVQGSEQVLQNIQIENMKTHELSDIRTDGVFVYIGTQPASDLYKGQVKLDDYGYIAAGEDTVTSIPGVFAAGDVRTKPLRQVVTAAADGAVAGVMAEKFLLAQKAGTENSNTNK